jgi:hypothetical protein
MPANNYFWGYLRNSLLWSIAAQGESTNAAAFRDDALVTRWQNAAVPYFEHGSGLGGVAQEGAQYGRYLLSYPVLGFLTVEDEGDTSTTKPHSSKRRYSPYFTRPHPRRRPDVATLPPPNCSLLATTKCGSGERRPRIYQGATLVGSFRRWRSATAATAWDATRAHGSIR